MVRARWAALLSPPEPAASPQVQECDRRSLVRFLVGLVTGMPSRAHSLAVLRGAQAGLLRHGLHLRLPGRPERWSGPGFTDPPFTSPIAEQIRSRVVDPVHACAVAALLVTGLPPALLGLMRLSNLAPDAAMLSSYLPFRIDYLVPEWGRDLFAAARVYAAGHHPGDGPLLSRGIGRTGQILADTARQCGLRLRPAMLAPGLGGWHVQVRCWLKESPQA